MRESGRIVNSTLFTPRLLKDFTGGLLSVSLFQPSTCIKGRRFPNQSS